MNVKEWRENIEARLQNVTSEAVGRQCGDGGCANAAPFDPKMTLPAVGRAVASQFQYL